MDPQHPAHGGEMDAATTATTATTATSEDSEDEEVSLLELFAQARFAVERFEQWLEGATTAEGEDEERDLQHDRRYRTMEAASLRLQKEAKGYLDSLRGSFPHL